VRVPKNAQQLDCTGLTITAGFWNSHVHFFERKWANADTLPADELSGQLEEMLTRYGFTSVFDLGSPFENTRRLRKRIESGEVRGPRIFTTGSGIVPPNPGVPPAPVLGILGVMAPSVLEASDAGEASAHAAKALAGAVDGIKLFASSQSKTSLSEEAMGAVVKEARKVGKPVFVHPNTSEDVMFAARAGVGIIAHTTPSSGPWDGALLAMMKERGVALIPTLGVWKYNRRHDRHSVRDQAVQAAAAQLRAWTASGGAVLFGDDGGYTEYPPGDEYALLAGAGLSFSEILASLTTLPADRFGESKVRGRIAAGMVADLVVLRGDPATDVRALAGVAYTVRGGRVIFSRTGFSRF
jgi:imidazolonepropionase-like amidohydrolase